MIVRNTISAKKFNSVRTIGLTFIPIVGALLNGLYNGPLYREDPRLFWVADVIVFVIAPIIIAYWLARYAKIFPKDYGLRPSPYGGFESLAFSIFLAFVLFVICEAARNIGWIFTWRWYVEPDFSYAKIAPVGSLKPLVALYWALSAGLTESVFYIGLPLYFWRNQHDLANRRRLSLWVCATIFAVVHWEQGLHNVIAAFTFGFMACMIYWKNNELWPIVGAHALIDFFKFL